MSELTLDSIGGSERLFARHDPIDPLAHPDYCTRQLARFRALTPEQQSAERAADKVQADREYSEWLAAGTPDPLENLISQRAVQREAAQREWDALHRWLGEGDDEATDEQIAEHETRVAAWRRQYAHLWPSILKLVTRKGVTSQTRDLPMPANLSIVPQEPTPDLLQSSEKFVAGFEPPDFLIDGVLQRRYFYSLTAATGSGKTAIAMRLMGHVATGRPLNEVTVEQGTTLYFAGENPSDIQARWLGLMRDMGIGPKTDNVHFLVGAMDLSQVAERITAEVVRKGLKLALVVVDTAAAYNFSEDENSNSQAGAYARQLRSLTQLPGGPCVIVLCHPTKRAGEDDLIPRGGGAFLAEVDGNIALQNRDSLLVASPQGKFRGAEFAPLRFELETMRDHPALVDTRGRPIPTVIAKPVGESKAGALEGNADRDTEALLRALSDAPGASASELARALDWTYGAKKEPNHMKAGRILKKLAKDKMVIERLKRWRCTPTADRELNAIDLALGQQ